MNMILSVTNKWQVHIPKKARQALKMDKPGVVEAKVEDNKLIITPKKSEILKMAGKYQSYGQKPKINIDNIRDYIDYSRT